jgi:hypothetical protein
MMMMMIDAVGEVSFRFSFRRFEVLARARGFGQRFVRSRFFLLFRASSSSSSSSSF